MTAPAPLIVGFGVTGRALARHLRGATVVDDHPAPDAAIVAAELGVVLAAAPRPDRLGELVGAASMVVVSPGVPIGHLVFVLAAAAGVPVRSEIELGWRMLAGRAAPRPRLVAVTGTNGKTTVVTLVAAMLAASGFRVATAGNIGTPLVDVADGDLDVIVAEVSSFQHNGTDGWRPEVSGWLNVSPDHLDWHPSLDDYVSAKARIWANQAGGDTVVVNADDPTVMARAAGVDAGARLVTFSTSGPADYSLDGDALLEVGEAIIPAAAMVRRLPHDLSNALAATAMARAAGARLEGCAAALREVAPLPHRVELVASADGVSWYDDSKATTPASVLAAVAGFSSVVLIAGGRNKGLDLRALRGAVPPVRSVVAIGEAAAEVSAALSEVVPLHQGDTMAQAVALAGDAARPGDAVMLSPGCASFDWYRSYVERGDDFAHEVRRRIADDATRPPREVRPC